MGKFTQPSLNNTVEPTIVILVVASFNPKRVLQNVCFEDNPKLSQLLFYISLREQLVFLIEVLSPPTIALKYYLVVTYNQKLNQKSLFAKLVCTRASFNIVCSRATRYSASEIRDVRHWLLLQPSTSVPLTHNP